MPQGSISIVCTGDLVAACWNEMLTVAAEAAGVVGLVIDGYVARHGRHDPAWVYSIPRGLLVRGTIKTGFAADRR